MTTYADALKRIVEVGMEAQFNDEKPFFNDTRVKKKNTGWGEHVEHPILLFAPINMGNRNGSSDTLPVDSIPQIAKYKFTPKFQYQGGRFYGDVLARAAGGDASAQDVNTMTIDAHRQAFVFETIRQMHADGSARLAKITSSSTTAPTVDDATWLSGNATEPMNVDVFDSTNALIDSDKKISAVNKSTRTITIDTLGGDRTDHFILRKGNKADGATLSHEIMGLQGAVNTASGNSDDDAGLTTFQNIDRSAHPQWEALVQHNSGTSRAVSAALIYRFCALLARECAGKKTPELALCDPAVYLEVALLQAQDRRYASKKFDGGDDGISWTFAGGRPIKFESDRFIRPKHSIYFLNLSSFTLYKSKSDIEFLHSDLTGQKFYSLVPSGRIDAVGFEMRRICELVCDSPRANGRLMDLSYGAFDDPLTDRP